jgi:hypothetical protein
MSGASEYLRPLTDLGFILKSVLSSVVFVDEYSENKLMRWCIDKLKGDEEVYSVEKWGLVRGQWEVYCTQPTLEEACRVLITYILTGAEP